MLRRHQRVSYALTFILATGWLLTLTGQSAANGARMIRLPDTQAISSPRGTDYPTTIEESRPTGPAVVLPLDTSIQFHLSGEQAGVYVANPDIADVQIVSKEKIIVFAKKPGRTSLYVHNNAGDLLLSRNIESLGPVILMRGAKVGDDPPAQFLLIPTQPLSSGQAASR